MAAVLMVSCGDDDTSSSGDRPVVSEPAQPSASSAVDPVTLRMGTDDEPGVPAADQIEKFATLVDEMSNGRMRIEPVWRAGGDEIADWDQVIARMVMGGELDLAMVPARAWDTEGITSLRAVHAPFLVTSDELLGRVATDPIAAEMLGGLEPAGVIGLALVPEGLRHVFSFDEPFLSVADFRGTTIRAPTSNTTYAALRALGATADDFAGPGQDFAGSVTDGTVAAAESSFPFAGTLPADSATAANVTLFPKVNSIVVHADTFEQLNEEQQQILSQAALDSRDWAISTTIPDAELAQRFCAAGGRVVVASDAELAALVQEVAAVYADLEADAVTKAYIERIRELAAEAGMPAPVTPCGPPADGAEIPIPTPPTVEHGSDVRLVVNTQLGPRPSPVVSAEGVFESCTTVEDLDATITDLSPDIDLFTGEKRISCPGGDVTIRYDVMMNANDPGVTSGTWSIVASHLAGASRGGGQLAGDPEGCELLPGSELCVLDTFTGTVAG
jgi:TRAP-type C4-dicarboxylate transport system substrate-binding protein